MSPSALCKLPLVSLIERDVKRRRYYTNIMTCRAERIGFPKQARIVANVHGADQTDSHSKKKETRVFNYNAMPTDCFQAGGYDDPRLCPQPSLIHI